MKKIACNGFYRFATQGIVLAKLFDQGVILFISLQDRVAKVDATDSKVQTIGRSLGNRQMTFDMKKPPSKDMRKREFQMKQHREERKKLIRPIKQLKLKKVNFK